MIKQLIYVLIDYLYQKNGFNKGYGVLWLKSAIDEYKASDLPAKEKIWALKRGFYPFRIAQYGLTEENYTQCLSDRMYKKLYPLNNSYKKWIDDKLSMKYILSPFDEFLPKYYFHLLAKRKVHVLKLADCPQKYNSDYEGILNLLKEKGELAVKPTGGTYGIGFCKLMFADGKYFVNGTEKNTLEMHSFLKKLQDHIIIEYVHMHPEIKRLNPNSLNTIRVMLINETGCDPYIASSFMRIGTKQSGIVDNTAQGGMFCKVDIENGRFYDGEKINDHIISPASHHPDTGEPIEGIIPNWSLVKEKLIAIANYMPQLEWMGFDIAITEKGFNIIEINSHQGLHRYHTYPEDVKEYFNRKTNKERN